MKQYIYIRFVFFNLFTFRFVEQSLLLLLSAATQIKHFTGKSHYFEFHFF